MPFELSFSKSIKVDDDSIYINECCFGGDVIASAILPSVQNRFGPMQADQEDWGWYIWFHTNTCALAIDIFCDDSAAGNFRIHLTSRMKRVFFFDLIIDVAELEELNRIVVQALEQWIGAGITVERLDKNYNPIEIS